MTDGVNEYKVAKNKNAVQNLILHSLPLQLGIIELRDKKGFFLHRCS